MPTTFVDYYEVLGLNFGATAAEIKAAYRKIARELHPDSYIETGLTKEQEDDMRVKFTKATEAFDVLRDEASKKAYDLRYIEEQVKAQNISAEQERAAKKDTYDYDDYVEYDFRRSDTDFGTTDYDSERTGYDYREPEEKYRRYEPRHARKTTVKKSILDEIKKSHKEIRAEEKKYSFRKRHQRVNDFYEEQYDNAETIFDDLNITFKKGIVHLTIELFYQLRKLSYINKESIPKYVIRNRKTFASFILAGVILSGMPHGAQEETRVDYDDTITPPTPIVQVKDETPEKAPLEDMLTDVTLTRVYNVEFGDCLSVLAYEARTSISEIKRINGLDGDTIYVDDVLRIPYQVSKADLGLYTRTIPVEGRSLADIAEEFDTDVATLVRLNKEAIIEVNPGVYVILSDHIDVPKFISRNEYDEMTMKTYSYN